MEYYLVSEQEGIQNRLYSNDLKLLFQPEFIAKLSIGNIETESIILPVKKMA